jgi:hypothetical protein
MCPACWKKWQNSGIKDRDLYLQFLDGDISLESAHILNQKENTGRGTLFNNSTKTRWSVAISREVKSKLVHHGLKFPSHIFETLLNLYLPILMEDSKGILYNEETQRFSDKIDLKNPLVLGLLVKHCIEWFPNKCKNWRQRDSRNIHLRELLEQGGYNV